MASDPTLAARRLSLALLLTTALAGCARHSTQPLAPLAWSGPRTVEVDLLRPAPGGSRIYVQATLPDGEQGLFLVDTGAAISALSQETAERLGLSVEDTGGYVSGLAGQAPLLRASVDELSIGEAELHDVEFAVGVRGVPERAGMMPLDGILGNNVWSLFDLEIDYPADLMVLHRPGAMPMPRQAQPMFFDGSFVYTPLVVTTAGESPQTDRVVLQVDTGAGELLLSGPTGTTFADDYTEGLEQIRGIGASETLPPSRFQQRTRRVPLQDVALGGQTVEVDFDARWVNFDQVGPMGPDGLRGLAGHELLAGHVAKFAYADGRFALQKSRRRPRQLDGHRLLLDQDVARHGADPERAVHRARLHLGMDDTEGAIALLVPHVKAHPEDDEARIFLAALHRYEGDLEAADAVLAPLSPADLVEQGEIVALVNGLVLEGRLDEALALAEEAVAARPEEAAAHVALADALVPLGRAEEANVALLEAARIDQYPDAYLVRRARASLALGDHYGAMAHMRKLLQLYPSGGPFLWFYAMLVDEEADVATFRVDMERAVAQLHPQHRPLDFMVAAHRLLGEETAARELMEEGIERDCDRSTDEASRDNCIAWYMALAGSSTDEALERVDRALAESGERSDFLDTKAMVHLARGEYDAAWTAARAAARLSPDDWYMLWQERRLAELVEQARATP